MQQLITLIFFDPLLNVFIFLYKLLFSDMGLAIIAFTVLVRLLLFPLNLKSLVSQRKIQHLKPHLDVLKERHAEDKVALAQAQMELYKKEGVNPAGGCVWLLIQLPFLFGILAVLRFVVNLKNVGELNHHLYTAWLYIQRLSDIHLHFLWVNLGQADPYLILPILAGLTQFLLSRLTLPAATPSSKKSENLSFEEAMAQSSRQMMYLFPVMTVLFTWRLPSGLALYWTIGNVFSILQQYYVNHRHPAPVLPTQEVQPVALPAATSPITKESESRRPKKRSKK